MTIPRAGAAAGGNCSASAHERAVPAIRPSKAEPTGAALAVATMNVPAGDTVPLEAANLVAAAARALEAPMQAIGSALPSLEPGPRAADPAVQRYTVGLIHRETQRIEQTITALRDLCALRARAVSLRTESLELGDLLMSVIPRWKPRAPQHTLELALPGALPTILADVQRAEQVIDSMLEHALRLAPVGDTVRASVRHRQEHVVVTIRHHGHVAVPERLDALFEPFARMPGEEEVVAGGGLGLAVARAILELHGGQLWAELPDSGVGLLLHAAWPLVPPGRTTARVMPAPDSAVAPVAEAARDVTGLQVTRTRPVVLIVHADARMARYLRANLEAEQCHALVVATLEDAVPAIDQDEPDVVVLDDSLPGVSCAEALRRLRVYGGAPVVVLARHADAVACANVLDAGARDYVGMPFSMEELLARVRATLRDSLPAPRQPEAAFTCGDLTVDFAQRAAVVRGQAVALSKTEFKLLRVLAQHAGMVVSHEVLLARVWGPAYTHEVAFAWVYVRRLRRKIEAEPSRPRYILTVPGVGYRLARGS